MDYNLSFHLTSHWLIALAMLAVLFAAVEFGFRAGVRKRGIPDADRSLMSGTGAAMLGLMGLLLGFTLSMAIGRWDDRRAIIIDESNAIGTLWLRAGFIKEPVRSQLRSALQEYNESRIVLGGRVTISKRGGQPGNKARCYTLKSGQLLSMCKEQN